MDPSSGAFAPIRIFFGVVSRIIFAISAAHRVTRNTTRPLEWADMARSRKSKTRNSRQLWFQARTATFAIIEILTCINWHRL
jgi:hypothetical protein